MKELLNKVKTYIEINEDTNTELYYEVLDALQIKKEIEPRYMELVKISQTFESEYHIDEKNYIWETITEEETEFLESVLIRKDYEISKRECTSLGKIILSHIKHFESFPMENEIAWIIEKRKSNKKLTAPSVFSKAFQKIKKENGFAPNLDESFFYHLKNINYENVKYFLAEKKDKEKHPSMISDFSQFE